MKLHTAPIEQCENWAKNPRNIRKKDFARLKRQIQDVGIIKPLLAEKKGNKFIILGGNMRLRAYKDLGYKQVDLILIEPKNEAARIKIALADNDRAGEYDEQALAELVYAHADEIKLTDYKIDFGHQADLESVLTAFGPEFDEGQEDLPPEPEEGEAIAKYGDIYTLGNHRLVCGDSTSQIDTGHLMQGKKAAMVFTDPPYNVDYSGGRGEAKFGTILNDAQTEDEFVNFTLKFMELMKFYIKDEGVFYICTGFNSYGVFVYAIKKCGLTFSCPIIWIKNNSGLGWADYRHKHEIVLKARKPKGKKIAQPILYGWNGGRHYYREDRFETDVWEIKKVPNQQMIHPTQKPLQLIRRAMRNSRRRGDLVLDFFGGSGATLIASEQEGRHARIMELDPKYIDVIIRRYAAAIKKPEDEIRAESYAGNFMEDEKAGGDLIHEKTQPAQEAPQ